jgi:hypothetical protein
MIEKDGAELMVRILPQQQLTDEKQGKIGKE